MVNKATYILSNVTLVEGLSLGAIWKESEEIEGICWLISGPHGAVCSWTWWLPVTSHCHNVDYCKSVISQECKKLHFHTYPAYHNYLITKIPTGSKVV